MSRTVLVVGGSRSIGAAVVAGGTALGWAMWHVSRGEPALGVGRWLPGDVALSGTVAQAMKKVTLSAGGLDAVVFNVAAMHPEFLGDLSETAVRDTLAVNFQALAETVDAALEAGCPRIVLIGSVAAMGSYGNGMYAASKAALEEVAGCFGGLSETRCWCLRLGAVADGLLAREPVGEALDLVLPRGRALSSLEVSRLVLLFAGGQMDLIGSGVILASDGLFDFPVLGRVTRRLERQIR